MLLLISFLMAFLLFPQIIRWAASRQYFESSDARKLHKEQVSALGGVGIFVAGAGVAFFSNWSSFAELWPVWLSVGLLFITSLWDDLQPLSAISRLVLQVVIATLLYVQGWAIPLPFSYPLTVFFVLLMINAYNFIDGINGLSGTLGVLGCLGFAVLFALQNNGAWASICLAFGGSFLAFLWFNFGKKAQVFLGDNGSTVLGLLLAVCTLEYYQGPLKVTMPNLAPLGLILLPILDVLRVVSLRIFQRKSPFRPDRQHFHHLYVDSGWSPATTCWVALAGQLLVLGSMAIPAMGNAAYGYLLLVVIMWYSLPLVTTNSSIPVAVDHSTIEPVG